MANVCLVSAGMMRPKKGGGRFRYMHRYLNYGLLGLSSAVSDYWPVIHGNFSSPAEFILENPELLTAKSVLLSVPSFYALEWSQDFLMRLKAKNRNCDLHIGGRWVLDKHLPYVRGFFPDTATFHKGFGETSIQKIANKYNAALAPNFSKSSFGGLDYGRLKYRDEFHVSIEVSRGCGLGCHFCEEADVPLTKLKSPAQILDEYDRAKRLYKSSPRVYLEASIFAPSEKWTRDFATIVAASGDYFEWRTECRVDTLSEEKVALLASSGMKVIDLGLESASPSQLAAMGKSRNPDNYLKRASELIAACHKFGVAVKLNILLYPGETHQTISETRQFLAQHKRFFKGVSAYPVLAFGFGDHLKRTQMDYSKYPGCSLVPTQTPGVWDVNLSREISSQSAKEICRNISQDFMSSSEYFFLKSFGYFRPDYTEVEFQADLQEVNARQRPCGK